MAHLREPVNPSAALPWEEGLEIVPCGQAAPSLSIVIPIRNAGGFIEKTLRSLLCNDLSGVELILRDGCSTDDTMSIVDRYSSMFSSIHSEKDLGQSDAINKGFDEASGEILYWLNGDDIILPNCLTSVRQYFAQNHGCQVLVGNAYMTEKDFSPINHFVFSQEKLDFSYLLDYAKNHLIQPSVFFTRQAWQVAGPLNVDDQYAMDADLFLGMASAFRFHHLDQDLAYSVYHEDCKTRGARAESITALALAQAKHGGLGEARKTLDLIVDLYRAQEAQPGQPPVEAPSRDTPVEILASKVTKLETLISDQRALMLDLDLRENP